MAEMIVEEIQPQGLHKAYLITNKIFVTLTFFSLMMNQYYNALIHTDLVVHEVPEAPYS